MYDKYPGFVRVSTIADNIARLESDGLAYVGGTWASRRAVEIATEILEGTISPDVQKWLDHHEGAEPIHYLSSEWFKKAVSAGVTREQQAAADRGTILNLVWDVLNDGATFDIPEAIEYALMLMEQEAESARISRQEYETAVELGLIDKDDKSQKPKRGYQCELGEVAPYIGQLVRWFHSDENQFVPIYRQKFLVDESAGVMGTCDDVGEWHGQLVVCDLKSSTSKQPKVYNRAQIAQYWKMLGSNTDMGAMNIIVTEEGVYPRMVTTQGLSHGLKDFEEALNIYKRKSMKGSFASSAASKAKVSA